MGSLMDMGNSGPYGISADGATVSGDSDSAAGVEAYVWSEATGMVGIGELPGGGFYSSTHGLSQDGLTAHGERHSTNGFEAFVWTASGGIRRLRQERKRTPVPVTP